MIFFYKILDISATIYQLFLSNWIIIMTFPKLEISFQKSLKKEYENKADKEETIPLKLTETIVDFQDPSSYFDQEAYRKQLRPIEYEDNTFHLHVIAIFLGFLMMFIIIIGILEMNGVNVITASPWDSKEKLSCVYQFCVQM